MPLGRRPHDPQLDRVRAVLAPLAVSHGVAVVDVVWATERSGRTLRVTIERPGAAPTDVAGSVSLEDCAELSRDLSQALDVDDFISGAYVLEVSSPGLERELLGLPDFVRFVGMLAKVKLDAPASDGQRLLRGTLESVDGTDEATARLTMRVDGKVHTVPFANVVHAQLVYELATEAKPGPKRAGKPGGKAKSSKGGGPSTQKSAGAKGPGASDRGPKKASARSRA